MNWPEQHYENGCGKNINTGRRFKSVVRILKALSTEMAERRVSAGDVPGFLIECLVWNAPNDRFQHATYAADVRAILMYVYEQTKVAESCAKWVEVSQMKWLFRPTHNCTREQANAFTLAAWIYVGFGNQP